MRERINNWAGVRFHWPQEEPQAQPITVVVASAGCSAQAVLVGLRSQPVVVFDAMLTPGVQDQAALVLYDASASTLGSKVVVVLRRT